MKRIVPLLLVTAVAFAGGALFMQHRQTLRFAEELQRQQAAWDAEKAALQSALDKSRSQNPVVATLPVATSPQTAPAPNDGQFSGAKAVLDELKILKPSADQPQVMSRIIALLELLKEMGPGALPDISDFLKTHQDIVYRTLDKKTPRDARSLADGLVPPTLRIALFGVVRQIGGPDAETILVTNLSDTLQGMEVVCLAYDLEAMSPGTYRGNILDTVHSLLADGRVTDNVDREFLYGILQRLNDTSFIATANSQLILPNGQIDRNALNYLKQAMGDKSIALVTQLYQDNRLTEPGSKEPLARLALAYVGANEQAENLYHTAILDPSLQPDQVRNLVEDLNEDGLSSTKNPTADDLKIIANRYALTQAYLQQDYVLQDKILNAAFHEADKDLRNMLQKAAAAQAAAQAAH